MNPIDYDVAIVGAGPAGLAAALWCNDLQLRAIVLEGEPETGGQLLEIHEPIVNYPGLQLSRGKELRERLTNQLAEGKAIVRADSTVIALDPTRLELALESGDTVRAAALVLATGLRRRRLGFLLESSNRTGMLATGVGQGPAVHGRRVCVVGGGDAAAINAVRLSQIATSLLLIHRGARLTARRDLCDTIARTSNIHVLKQTELRHVIEDGSRITAVEIENLRTLNRATIPIDALLVRIGFEPNTTCFGSHVNVDERGYVQVDRDCESTVPNVFAVGDVANPGCPTLPGAAGDAATAIKAIAKRLNY